MTEAEADGLRANLAAVDVDEALALAWLAVRDALGLEAHVEQTAGAAAMSGRCVVEMATGEGKTITAALGALLFARRGRGCHVITVNDYLAQRDAEWMRGVYERCGLRVASVTGAMDAPQRREAYSADVVYVTHKEVVADFLRDRLTLKACVPDCRGVTGLLLTGVASGCRLPAPVLRGLAAAIVDEADSVLIDDAVTPLILSAPDAERTLPAGLWQQAKVVADGLEAGPDYATEARSRRVRLTEAGR
ncbi:MAG: hypothetical protein KDA21_12815, partial [Phycisphaerales bacterium]|nr:hypothetical protein [Phycisphaerales bacterium]